MMNTFDLNRRRFLRTCALSATAISAAPFLRAAEPARQYKTALIGSGWWGKNILVEALASGRCKGISLCDVDAHTLEVAAERVLDLTGTKPKTYKDYRELLEQEQPELVIIATPDHWHALPVIAALRAGAHVFVEKPTGHNIQESQAMLKAAQASGRVVQVGLHRRIGPHYQSARRFLQSGAVGEVGMVRLFVHQGGGKEAPSLNSAPPDGMDWDFWCGPGPLRPFNTRIHPGGWRQFLDYGNGQLGDWGVHWLDQVLGWTEQRYPKRVFSTAGRPVRGAAILTAKEQTTDAPDHQVAVYEFEDFTLTWEHRMFAENRAEKHSLGAYFYGSKGTLHIGWKDGWTFYPAGSREKTIHEDSQLQEPDGHNLKLLWTDFIEAIEQKRKPAADIEPAHRASVMAFLGMISWKVGRSLVWDGNREEIVGDAPASALMGGFYRAPWPRP